MEPKAKEHNIDYNLNEGPAEKEKESWYYAVHLPFDCKDWKFEEQVFENKIDALKFMKVSKKARYKSFNSYLDAIQFVRNGLEVVNSSLSELSFQEKQTPGNSQLIGEKASPFKAPKSQDLVKFRKAIETGDISNVNNIIWDNPRYLVSSGDTPSILQEGCRYNALHIAAKAKNHLISELILKTVSNVEFVKLLYGDGNYDDQLANERVNMLVDLYLNTPDKGLNETPLHFAVKFGAEKVVEVLLSYPQCDKMARNKFDKSPDMMICDRCDDLESSARRKKIALLLEGSYYVPVLRAEDNTMAPTVGEPFSPSSPPVLHSDPLSPKLEICAYAGPLNKREADKFRKVWRTPPRNTGASKGGKRIDMFHTIASLRYKDADKGLERLGKSLAQRFDVTWKEYWSFLDSFVDIASAEGLGLFENYLASRLTRLQPAGHIEELAGLMEGCNINSSPDGGRTFSNPYSYIETACQVFANRIASNIYSAYASSGDVRAVLEREVRQVDCLLCSYRGDIRFHKVNFQLIHPRLGKAISQKLLEYIARDDELALIRERLEVARDDWMTRADEAKRSDNGDNFLTRIYLCILEQLLRYLNCTDETFKDRELDVWKDIHQCGCDFRESKVNEKALCRTKSSYFNKAANISKKLNFIDTDEDSDFDTSPHSSDAPTPCLEPNDIDCFYTPPSSPGCAKRTNSQEEEEEDEFFDAEVIEEDIFILGSQPTKLDCEVYDALNFANYKLSCDQYPNVFKWYHAVNLFSEKERRNWQNPSHMRKTHGLDSPRSPMMCNADDSGCPGDHFHSSFYGTDQHSPKSSLNMRHNM